MANLTSPKHAFYHYGFDTPTMANEPKQKHTFMTQFVVDENSLREAFPWHNPDYLKELRFDVKSVDKPKVNYELQTLNQYNKKRVVINNHEYQPINIRFYDKAQSHALKFLIDYNTYYFGDMRYNGEWDWADDILEEEMNGAFGFAPIHNNLNLIKFIRIYHFYNRYMHDVYTYINPKIQNLDFDMLDYSDSQVSEVNVTFMYETVMYETVSAKQNTVDIADKVFDLHTTSGINNDLKNAETIPNLSKDFTSSSRLRYSSDDRLPRGTMQIMKRNPIRGGGIDT